jgi:hypothetical protein
MNVGANEQRPSIINLGFLNGDDQGINVKRL